MSAYRRPSALSVSEVVAQVEALAQEVYEDAMGRDWPVPYSALKVSEQEEWRGKAYCATYALALCPVTKTVHPWLRSWCMKSCLPACRERPGEAFVTANSSARPYRQVCPVCKHNIAVDDDGRFWAHGDRWGCSQSGKPSPDASDPTSKEGR